MENLPTTKVRISFFQYLDDKVLFKLDWSTKSKNDQHQKSVAFADGSNSNEDNSRVMEKLEALTIKIDSQFQSLNEEMHEMRKNYNNRGVDNASKNNYITPRVLVYLALVPESGGYRSPCFVEWDATYQFLLLHKRLNSTQQPYSSTLKNTYHGSSTPVPDTRSGRVRSAGKARQVGPATARADLYGLLILSHPEITQTYTRGVNQRLLIGLLQMTEEDEIIYSQLDDARHDRALLRARVNMLYRDRPFHRRTALLMEEEARVSHAAWAWSMDACDQQNRRRNSREISDLLKADYRDHRQLVEALKIVKSLKTQISEPSETAETSKYPAEPSYQGGQKLHQEEAYDVKNPEQLPPPVADPTTTTSVTSAQLQAMINQGVTAVLAA
ncbi:hypothetical protein Tco_0451063 [Tanacetum coccineum]